MNKINLRPALASMDYDEEILYSVVAAFIQEVPSLIEQLEDAILADDRSTGERAAHTLKGNFRLLQLERQQDQWARIEAKIHNDGISDISDDLPSARSASNEAIVELQEILNARES